MKKTLKIVIPTIILVLVLSLLLVELNIGKNKLRNKSIAYTKESKISYLTYLKDNNHYEEDYIQNGYNLVANLIDYFNLDYNYTYSLSEKINYELNYDIKAVLDIYDGDNSTKPIDRKQYTLLENQKLTGNSQIIKVDIHNQKVVYDLYHDVIESWKRDITPNAELKILFNVNWTGYSDILGKVVTDTSVATFNIPISEKVIDIKNPASVNENGTIEGDTILSVPFIVVISSTLLLLVVDLICLIYNAVSLRNEKSKYDIKVDKILREFDRAITRVKGSFEVKKDYVEVMDFMELLDAHDNLGLPIMHYRNSKNLNYFVVKTPDITYYATLKRKDFE